MRPFIVSVFLFLSLSAGAEVVGYYVIEGVSNSTAKVIKYYDLDDNLINEEGYYGEARQGFRPKIPSGELIQTAFAFRQILSLHFGSGAETNRAVTESVVTDYFIGRRLGGTSQPNDAYDALILSKGFDSIKKFTGDDTSWTFFDEYNDEVDLLLP